MAKVFIAGVALAWGAALTLAQAPDVAQPPPRLDWPQWRELETNEVSRVYGVTLPSAYVSSVPENDLVPIRAMLPAMRERPVPAVIILHYWGATDLRVERSMATRLNQRGIAAVLVTLPYHLERTPPSQRSGALAIQPDPDKLRAMMTQGVWDVRRTLDWMESRPEFQPGPVGLMGTSLGSIMAGLAFGLDARLGYGCFILGGADLAGLVWRSSRAVGPRDALRRRGWSETTLRAALDAVEPLTYLRPTDRPTYVIGARFDTVVPPSNVQRLIDALGSPQVLWIDTGHFGGAFIESALLNSAAAFFEASFAGKRFKAPGRLYAPTLRFGVVASGERGVQVALGLDLWRGRSTAGPFAALVMTPRGPQLFGGAEISRGFSIGITVLPKRTTWGAFWSFVM